MFQGILIGAGAVVLILVMLNFIDAVKARIKNRKQYLPDVTREKRLRYIAMSQHNDEAVDRLFNIKR